MNHPRLTSPKVLLLLSRFPFYVSAKNILEDQGFEILESFEGNGLPDLFVIDDFFTLAGAGEALEILSPEIPRVEILHENTHHSKRGEIDERLILPKMQNEIELRKILEETFRKSQYLNMLKVSPRQFGEGLWSALIQHVHRGVSNSASVIF